MLEIEPKSRDRVYKVKTFGTLHDLPYVEKFISHEVVSASSVRDYTVLMLDAEGHVTSRNARAERIKSGIAGDILDQNISFSAGYRRCRLWNGNCFKLDK